MRWYVLVNTIDKSEPVMFGPYPTERVALEVSNNLEILVLDEEEVVK